MAYSLILFGDVELPAVMVTDDLSTGEVASTLVDSVGGVYDWYGAERRLPRRQALTQKGQYVGTETRIGTEDGDWFMCQWDTWSAGSAVQMLQAQIDRLKAALGKREKLWRRRDADGVLTWRWARLLQVQHTETVANRAAAVADVSAQFEMGNGAWRAESPTVIVSPAHVEVTGDVPIRDATLTVIPSSGTVTLVEVTGPGIDWSWAGSLATGVMLAIDDGAQTVREAGVDAYSGFALGVGHAASGWLTLEPGLSAMSVRVTGGAATVTLTYYEQVL